MADRMGPNLQQARWPLAAVAAVLLALAPAVVGTSTLAQRDTDRLYAPLRALVVEALREGRLPLWNPHEGLGKPLLAEGIHGVLHPVSLLAAALVPASVDALILGYLCAAALGAFLLARGLGASPVAAAGAGAAFALSGYSVSMAGNLVFLAGLSTLPWQLAGARAAGAGRPLGVPAAALGTACAFLSGDAQSALVGLGLGLALAAEAGGRRGAVRALGALVAGTLLAGVQIAPTAALRAVTFRSWYQGGDLDPAGKAAWALEPARILEWVIPGLWRGPLSVLPVPGGLPPDVFAESVHLGAPLLVAAAIGAGRRPGSRAGPVLAAGAAILLWLALGHHLGARQLLDGVPVWSSFRFSEKLMAPLTLCACALAALGVDAFAAASPSRRWRRALAGGALAAAASLVVLAEAAGAAPLAASLLGPEAGPWHLATLRAGLPHLALGLAALAALAAWPGRRVRAAGLAALLAASAGAASRAGAHLGDPGVRRLAPLALRAPPTSPAPRIAHPAEFFVGGAGRDEVDEVAEAWHRLLYPSVYAAHRVDGVEPYGAFASRRLGAIAGPLGEGWAHGFRRFGLTHLVLPLPRRPGPDPVTDLALDGATLELRDPARGVEVWAVPHRPWAFLAAAAVAVPGPAEAAARSLEHLRRGDDAVVVEAPAAPPTAPGRILAAARAPERVDLEVAADGPALLVVQEAFWPGWEAAVDGAPAPLLAADGLVRAVPVPAGRHAVTMAYRPPELRVGLALSALGAALAAGLWALDRRALTRRAGA